MHDTKLLSGVIVVLPKYSESKATQIKLVSVKPIPTTKINNMLREIRVPIVLYSKGLSLMYIRPVKAKLTKNIKMQ